MAIVDRGRLSPARTEPLIPRCLCVGGRSRPLFTYAARGPRPDSHPPLETQLARPDAPLSQRLRSRYVRCCDGHPSPSQHRTCGLPGAEQHAPIRKRIPLQPVLRRRESADGKGDDQDEYVPHSGHDVSPRFQNASKPTIGAPGTPTRRTRKPRRSGAFAQSPLTDSNR